jgi:hypothetical protein
VTVFEAAEGCVEEDDDGGVFDLMDGAGGALEVFGLDVAVDADSGADGEFFEGSSGLVGFGAGSAFVDGIDDVGEVVVEVSVADGCDEGVDVGSGVGFGHRCPVWPMG